MSKKDDNLEHRGRFQAQGGGVEESESWAQGSPLSIFKALGLLRKLMLKLTTKDLKRREKEFKKAESLIKEASGNGGVLAKFSKSFKVKGSKDERVDIEVLSGKAFVKDKEHE